MKFYLVLVFQTEKASHFKLKNSKHWISFNFEKVIYEILNCICKKYYSFKKYLTYLVTLHYYERRFFRKQPF